MVFSNSRGIGPITKSGLSSSEKLKKTSLPISNSTQLHVCNQLESSDNLLVQITEMFSNETHC